jgi:16S rRNA (cytosine967-C5)-methyltransferase
LASIPAALVSRHVALELLGAVGRGGRPMDEALADHKGFAALEPRDRAFVRNLLAVAFRRRGQIEALLGAFLAKPLPTPDAIVADILQLGLVQLLFLATPAHAAVDTSVRLTEAIGRTRLKGLVNAIMRRATREGQALVERQDAPRLNTPDWLWRSWLQAYGPDATRAIALSHLSEAPLDFTLRGDIDGWVEKLEAQLLPTGTLRRLSGGAVRDLPGFAEGAWWVQDAAAALPARLLGASADAQSCDTLAGKRVVDLCAAPGGKTLQLAAAGAKVLAVDVSARRLQRLADNLKRTGLTAELIAADAAVWRPDAPVDAVLLDAPCTASGTIRRHPDAPWRRRTDDVTQMAALQRRLLDHALSLLPPGGLLVYSVCSLQPEEGPARIDDLLASGTAAERVPVAAAELPGLEDALTPAGDVRTLPSQWADKGGLDGFFIARLRKR